MDACHDDSQFDDERANAARACRLLADVWPARALPGVLRALGGAPRLVLRFWEHYEVGVGALEFRAWGSALGGAPRLVLRFWEHDEPGCQPP